MALDFDTKYPNSSRKGIPQFPKCYHSMSKDSKSEHPSHLRCRPILELELYGGRSYPEHCLVQAKKGERDYKMT